MSNVVKGHFALRQQFESFDYDQYLAELFKDLGFRYERAGYSDEQDLVCSFTVDATEWKRWQKQGLLGGIYNRDLSNHLSRLGVMKHYAVPSVNDQARAKRGRKHIVVRFSGF